MRLIDADKLNRKDVNCANVPMNFIDTAPTVEAIPKTEMRKMLRDTADKVSDSILDIVREDYIHKSEYENRLKTDKIAMLTDLQLDVEGQKFDVHIDKDVWNNAIGVCSELIQQRIDELKGKREVEDD